MLVSARVLLLDICFVKCNQMKTFLELRSKKKRFILCRCELSIDLVQRCSRSFCILTHACDC